MENKSQNKAIRQHLEAGNTITPLEALNKFNCLRLGARIHNLKADGLAICSRLVKQNGKRFAEYSLSPRSLFLAAVAVLLLSSCTTYKPGCRAQRKYVHVQQLNQQYTHHLSAGQDWTRVYRNWHARPQKRTRIPFTNLYIR